MGEILTNRFGNGRVGANLGETVLDTSNVNVHQFGKLFARDVDGDVYAQPLVAKVDIPGHGPRMVVYVATATNSVYAYDAEDPAASTPYWHLDSSELGAAVPRTEVGPPGYHDFQKTVGVTSTPVIDLASNTIYFEAKSKTNGAYFHHLHARDLGTGRPHANSPVEITGSVDGRGAGNVGGRIPFSPREHLNRPGLLLMDSIIYVAFASQGDHDPYHGWVFAYDAATLAQIGVFCTTPDSKQGGIWQSGAGLAGDAGLVYCVAANGHLDTNGRDHANCLIQLQLDRTTGITVKGFYAPNNANCLSDLDLDMSTGPVLVPGTPWVLVGSKEGIIYLADFTGLTAGRQARLVQKFHAASVVVPPPLAQSFPPESNIHGTPVFWDGPKHGQVLYVWGENDYMRAWRQDGQGFTHLAHSAMHAPPGMPGGILTVSANGRVAGTGIVWASHPYTQDANRQTVNGILRAFDAADITHELWNSKQEAQRDEVGEFAKFCPPTVVNGRVYLATFAGPTSSDPNHLVVYGLLPDAPPPVSSWMQADVGTPLVGSCSQGSGRFVVKGAGDDIEGEADSFHFVYRKLTGDCRIQARVRSMTNTSEWAKAGVMVRQSLTSESPHAMMVITPLRGAAFQRRTAIGQSARHTPWPWVAPFHWVRTVIAFLLKVFGQQSSMRRRQLHRPVAPPYWVRMERTGNTFIGSVSIDGSKWRRVGSQRIDLGRDELVGLAVTAHNGSLHDPLPFNTSIFDNVTVSPEGP